MHRDVLSWYNAFNCHSQFSIRTNVCFLRDMLCDTSVNIQPFVSIRLDRTIVSVLDWENSSQLLLTMTMLMTIPKIVNWKPQRTTPFGTILRNNRAVRGKSLTIPVPSPRVHRLPPRMLVVQHWPIRMRANSVAPPFPVHPIHVWTPLPALRTLSVIVMKHQQSMIALALALAQLLPIPISIALVQMASWAMDCHVAREM
mmetsp:Transcript_32492/g.53731  ORF Transcript_32492/g.53731 Transcript_32492/m.53731 type:complete len:200 (-) Transcript_32492:1418-2017(-)